MGRKRIDLKLALFSLREPHRHMTHMHEVAEEVLLNVRNFLTMQYSGEF